MTILQALDRYYDRMAARGEANAPGWSNEPVGAILVLSKCGELRAVLEQLDDAGKKPRIRTVPKWFSRSGNASTPFFLWDNTAYVLGASTKDPGKTARDHEAFKALHLSELATETDAGLVALRRFLEMWTPDRFKAPFFHERMLAWNVAFRLDGEHCLIHENPAAKEHVERLRTSAESAAEPAFCLVTGRMAPPVRLHPKIKGINGTASAEVPLVSFNEPAFESYGRTQGYNAPTSQAAAFRYGAALNRMLDRRSPNRLLRPIGDATVVFWADAADEEHAEAAEDVFNLLFEPPSDANGIADLERDAEQAAKLRDALQDFVVGRPVAEPKLELARGVRFHILGLSPNAARLSVRFWITDCFEVFAARLADHYANLAIEPRPWRAAPPSVSRLLVKTTALQEKFDNIPPLLAGELARSVLTGTPYPRSLLAAALMRLRAGDDPATGWHAAAIRAVLARERRLKHPEERKWLMSLARDFDDPPYQLGRLFAALESAQRQALGQVNATIRDRYFGAASATPASVFPLLLRGAQNHLGKLRKDGKGSWIEREIEEIASRLPPDLPRTLKLEAQGRFAIGYYHQRKAQYAGRPAPETGIEEGEENVD